jgi:hypothetical protein
MEIARDPDILARMQMAFELFGAGEQMMRQNIPRRNPKLNDKEIEELIVEWLQQRPGAELGEEV